MKASLISLIILLLTFDLTAEADTIKIPPIDTQGAQKWQKFHSFTAKGLDGFVTNQSGLGEVTSVFYPFGGSDIIYPLTIFPNSTHLVLSGLENIGAPNIKGETAITLSNDVRSLIGRSFFVTADMGKNFSTKHIGVLHRILEQLALLGVHEADIESLPSTRKLLVTFTYKDIKRTIHYFRRNFLNPEETAAFLEEVKAENLIDGVLLKATSYTLHRRQFAHIKDFIIVNSSIIVQDDSGIPLRDLEKKFDVHKFGQYTKPYGVEFSCYTQPDLARKAAMNDEKLGFCFGYGCSRQPSVLLIAKKK